MPRKRPQNPVTQIRLTPNTPSAYLRGIQTLEALAPEPLTAAELGRALKVNRSTALRLLLDLEVGGYVARDPTTKHFSLIAARLWGLISHNHDHADWRAAVDPILSALRDEFGEATCFGVPANGFMVYMAFFPSLYPIGLSYERIGVIRPMHCSAIGKAYLSTLDPGALDQELRRLTFEEGTSQAARGPLELRERLEDARRDGYAVDWEETMEGGACVAVPVWVGDTLIGSAGMLGPINRLTRERITPIAERLVKEFSRISGSVATRATASR